MRGGKGEGGRGGKGEGKECEDRRTVTRCRKRNTKEGEKRRGEGEGKHVERGIELRGEMILE